MPANLLLPTGNKPVKKGSLHCLFQTDNEGEATFFAGSVDNSRSFANASG
jgi:hypothetical protein